MRRDGLGWAGATQSVRAQSHVAGLEEKGTELSRHGWEAGGAGPASPRVPPTLGTIPEPGLSQGSDCSTQTVHPHSFVIGTNLNTALNAFASSVVPFVIYFFN